MKTLLIGIAAIFIVGLAPQTAHALPPDFVYAVHGIVTENGLPVEGAEVVAECGGDSTPVGTNADGSYYAPFYTCFLGSIVHVRAWKGDSVGSASVLGTSVTTLNIELVKKIPVPEYGVIGATVAAGIGMGTVVFVRRRSTRQGASL